MIIREYNPSSDYEALRLLIQSEGEEWEDYLNPQYKVALENSITSVALVDGELCGYIRSIDDSGVFIWVIDLLVHTSQRGKSIGKQLMESLFDTYPDAEVYVLSDVDPYYEKLGYKREGSVYKVNAAK